MTAAPVIEAINLNSVVCTCCETRYWPDSAPMFPEHYVCEECEKWFRAYNVPGQTIPVAGPARALRRLFAGQPVTTEEFVTDQSAWVLIIPADHLRAMVEKLLEDPDANR
ncbi:hypothetical protein [Mycolicibacterium goodii]|uniref:hypothetical protein n=1 Tax=Mycolicibacterium goodii TaxID=134601 RepID=UPI001BDD57F7|nr:hypothetical protein [Mycolicibacterium goodii]MBU8834162.1 hypothetical protein [Mycolicibacterium goodii]